MRPARAGGVAAVSFGEPFAHGREVEAQASARAAEPDAAQRAGVEVDPVALDVQLAGDGRGVDEPARACCAVLVQQLNHAPGDLLDVVGDQTEGAVVVVGIHLSGCRWKPRAGLQLWGRLVAR